MIRLIIRFFKYILKGFALLFYSSATSIEPNRKLVDILKPKLNSARIEHIFGSYGIEQLKLHLVFFLKAE